jgi:hypothetical protein
MKFPDKNKIEANRSKFISSDKRIPDIAGKPMQPRQAPQDKKTA